MTKLEKLLGKVDELGSLAKIFSEMQASVGLMKREVALMKTKPPIHSHMMLYTRNPDASFDTSEDIQIRQDIPIRQDPEEAPSTSAVNGSVQCSHRSSLSSQDDAPSAAPSARLGVRSARASKGSKQASVRLRSLSEVRS
jgi:hypothetical protein